MNRAQCEHALLWISLKVDGEPLPAEAAQALAAHLEGCAACRDRLRAEDHSTGVLRRALRGDAARDLLLEQAIAAAAKAAPPMNWTEYRQAWTEYRQAWTEYRGFAAAHGSWRWAGATVAAAAAALVLVKLAGITGEDRDRGRAGAGHSEPRDVALGTPAAPLTSAPLTVAPRTVASPWTVTFEESFAEDQLLPAADGSPVHQKVERTRRFLLPALDAGRTEDAGARDRGVGLEQLHRENVHLTSWPYR